MPEDTPLISYRTNVAWVNKHLNVQRQVARLYDVWNRWSGGEMPTTHEWRAGLLALQQIVRDAASLGRRVRALGGGWSLSEVAATSDFMVNTKPLNFIKVGLKAAHCVPTAQPLADKLVFAQCGTSVLALNQVLESRMLSLKTSGASNGQTIAGAIATGTHGAAVEVGSMPDYVHGLHVIGADGEQFWIERASRPVVSDEFGALLGATLLRDDDLFRAALVSFGSFGIVHAVLLEAEPIYLLERYVRQMDYPDVAAVLSTLDVASLALPDGAAVPFHFEVVINPYARGRGERGAYLRAMYKRPYRPIAQPEGGAVSIAPGDDLMSVVGDITDVAPALIPLAISHVLDSEMTPVEGALGTHGQTFGSTTTRGAVLSMELGIARADAGRAVEAIASVAEEWPFAGVTAVRYVKGTDALLGFTRFPQSCTIEIPCSLSPRTQEAFERICDRLAARDVAHTLHWGQCLPSSYTSARLRDVHGADLATWIAARRGFLASAGARRMFANGVAERYGLAD